MAPKGSGLRASHAPMRRLFRVKVLAPLIVVRIDAAPVGGPAVNVERGSIDETRVVTGLTTPSITIDVRTEASGLVESLGVKEGGRVCPGRPPPIRSRRCVRRE